MMSKQTAAVQVAAVLAVACACGPLSAQQQPAKPTPRPAAPAASAAPATSPVSPVSPASAAARGFGNARGPLLTRDELRACLGQEDELKKRIAGQETARVPLEQEKKALGEEQAATRGERGKFDAAELNAAVAAFNERTKTLGDRRTRWEVRLKALTDAGRDGKPEEREALNVERVELEREFAALETERKRLVALQTSRQEAALAFNAKVAALDARVAEWNKRNAVYNDANSAIEADRGTWAGQCGNRRYREEDEIAIRSGK